VANLKFKLEVDYLVVILKKNQDNLRDKDYRNNTDRIINKANNNVININKITNKDNNNSINTKDNNSINNNNNKDTGNNNKGKCKVKIDNISNKVNTTWVKPTELL